MFKKIEALSSEKHQDLRFSKTNNFSFASKTNLIQLSFSEMRPASRFYPIVFPEHQPDIPHAVLSFAPENNNYIDADGKWKVPYVPFIIRTYPFLMLRSEQDESKNVLCIDSEADHFKEEYGDILFTADGHPNDFTNKMLNSLNMYNHEMAATKKIFGELIEKEVMVEKQISYEVNSEKKQVSGFKAINMEKINSLEDKEIATLVKNGAMSLIYEHIQSIAHFK